MRDGYTIYRYNPGTILRIAFYDWRGRVFEMLAQHLSALGVPVRVEERATFEVHERGAPRRMPLPDSLAIMQHERSGEYYVLDCYDLVRSDELELLVRDPRCRRILKAQYRSSAFARPGYEKVRPWTYFDRFWPEVEEAMVAVRARARRTDTLYFRGSEWGERGRVLEILRDRGLIAREFDRIEFDDYFRESSRHAVMLSLPGVADACNRDIEGFARGACVIRPRMRTEFHDPLVPDHHYVSVDVRLRGTDPVVVADALESRFREVVANPDYRAAVGRNAAQWYDANVRLAPAMELTTRLLGLALPAEAGRRTAAFGR